MLEPSLAQGEVCEDQKKVTGGIAGIAVEIPDIHRFPRVPDFVSSWRLVKGAKDSSGKKLGTSGKKIGTVHLRWACAAAAVLFLRQSQPGKEYFAKLAHNPGKATALTVRAHKLGRAVYYPPVTT